VKMLHGHHKDLKDWKNYEIYDFKHIYFPITAAFLTSPVSTGEIMHHNSTGEIMQYNHKLKKLTCSKHK